MALDINTASREELVALKGIGEELASAIIRARPLKTVDDLLSIPGIGGKNLDKLKEQGLTVISNQQKDGTMTEQIEGFSGGVMSMSDVAVVMAGEEMAVTDDMMVIPSVEIAMPSRREVISSEGMDVTDEMDFIPGGEMAVVDEMEVMPGVEMAVADEMEVMPGEEMAMADEMEVMPGEEMSTPSKMAAMPGAGMAPDEAVQDFELKGTWKLILTLTSLNSSKS